VREKKQLILFAVIFVVLIGGLGTLTYFQFRAYQSCKEDLAGLEKRKQAAERLIAEIPALRQAAKVLSEQVEIYAEILPKEHEVRHDAFVETMDRFARETGLQILRADPFEREKKGRPKKKDAKSEGAKESTPPFSEHRYMFELVGTFPSLLRFVNKIENWDRFLAVEEIEIVPEGASKYTNTSKKADDKEIEAAQKAVKNIQLVVTTYTHKPKEQTIDTVQGR
jgi:Tfp pilus assembly protein PilO